MVKSKIILVTVFLSLILLTSLTVEKNNKKSESSKQIINVVKDSIMAIELAEIILSKNYDSI